MVDPEVLAEMLRARIDSHLEWLLVRESGRTFPLHRDEIDISSTAGKVMFGSFDDTGFRISRVVLHVPMKTRSSSSCGSSESANRSR
jgi:hypothetical protein